MFVLAYFLVFAVSLLVDVVPFVGPPAWTVMVFFQVHYQLDIWLVLFIGVTGSAIGRYVYSGYIPGISDRFIKPSKTADLQFIGRKLARNGWKVWLFVLLYTLIPLPSTPLFTAVGIARIKPIHIMPSFFVGKFVSDAIMVLAGNFVAGNACNIGREILSWQTITGTILSLVIISMFLFVDWWTLITDKKVRIKFNIWK